MVVPVKPLFPLAEGVWTCRDPVRILGTRLTDRKAARTSVDVLLGHDFERLIVGHGTPIGESCKDALATAYRFLR
ncbi:MAG: hypothetical protein SFV15_25770 [Polyangiaceae bacterium]|nr:hypothetical protein [Polyangiaceae bacterium]